MPLRPQIAGLVLLLAMSSAAQGARRHLAAEIGPRRMLSGRALTHHAVGHPGWRVQAAAVHRQAARAHLPPRAPVVQAAGAPAAPVCDGLAGRTIAIDTTVPLHLGLKTYPQTLDLHDHEVVLTFDDGPSASTTPAVLDALRGACIKATFFLIGRNAAANPAIARRALAEGHTLGHHSMTHPAATLRGLGAEAGEQNIDEGIAADERAIYGEAAAASPHVPFFRFPGFADTGHLLAYLDTRHVAVFGTDLWAADWLPMTPDHERERVLDLLERSPHHNGIILFHDTVRSTAAMLPSFLRELKAKGYTIAHLEPAKAGGPPMQVAAAPEGWTSETEAIIAHVRPGIAAGSRRHRLASHNASLRRAEWGFRLGRRARTASRVAGHRI